jgi:hypothetical protein
MSSYCTVKLSNLSLCLIYHVPQVYAKYVAPPPHSYIAYFIRKMTYQASPYPGLILAHPLTPPPPSDRRAHPLSFLLNVC